jgi:transcriptional regulator with XRE-family HTH domain
MAGTENHHTIGNPEPLGTYLNRVRRATGMTLRDVEAATSKNVTNGYLSQIEKGDIKQPSPRILHSLAAVYGIDYAALLGRAGHAVPNSHDDKYGEARQAADAINGFPLRSLEDLTPDETSALMEYLNFIKSRR